MSKGKKNLLTILGLCALLAICLVLYLVVPQKTKGTDNTAEQSGENKDSVTVDSISDDAIEKVAVTKDGNETLSLVKKGEKWCFADNAKIPLNGEAVSALFGCLNPVKASKTLDKSENSLGEYGLDNPSFVISVTASGGDVYTYKLGGEVPVEGGNYGLTGKEEKIYCFSDALKSAFDIDAKTLIQKDELPEIEEKYMTSLRVDQKNKKAFEAKKVKKSERVDSYSDWNITAPYKKPLAASTKDWSNILGYFKSLSFSELVEYDSAHPERFGLASPGAEITVKYYEAKDGYTPEDSSASPAAADASEKDDASKEIPEKYRLYKTLKLLVGDKTESGYYVCLKGSRNIYTMSADAVENMTKLDVYTGMDHCVYATLATNLKGYDVTYGDTTLTITRTPLEKSDDDAEGKNKEQNLWKLNGKEIPENEQENFLTPYSSAYLLEFTSKAKNSVKPKSKEPVLTMVFHEDDRDVTVKYLPYDGRNFYRVDKNGMDYFLVDKRSVDDIITKFKEIEKFGK